MGLDISGHLRRLFFGLKSIKRQQLEGSSQNVSRERALFCSRTSKKQSRPFVYQTKSGLMAASQSGTMDTDGPIVLPDNISSKRDTLAYIVGQKFHDFPRFIDMPFASIDLRRIVEKISDSEDYDEDQFFIDVKQLKRAVESYVSENNVNFRSPLTQLRKLMTSIKNEMLLFERCPGKSGEK